MTRPRTAGAHLALAADAVPVAHGIGLDDALRRVDALEEEARHRALHDPLTGLPNRTLFVDRVHHALALAARNGGTAAVIGIDIDRFKVVNERHGHERGDELLLELAGRLGGAALAGRHARAPGRRRVRRAVRRPPRGARGDRESRSGCWMAWPGRSCSATSPLSSTPASGSRCRTAMTPSAKALVRDAGAAMSRAKVAGGARYELFDAAVGRRMAERLALEDDLRLALERDELELYYQPLVDLDERRIVAVEGLVRWRHPRQGVVLPGEFMTVAEESGLIVPLGRWVLREACRQLARWTADPAIDLPCLTVNLSGRQLAEASLPDELAGILHQYGVPPERLGLELTESVLMQETSSPTAVLQDLKGLGVRLMLDDFGNRTPTRP